ncbi:hypothetical protein [Candidatus Bealeia paramacronuclearis]
MLQKLPTSRKIPLAFSKDSDHIALPLMWGCFYLMENIQMKNIALALALVAGFASAAVATEEKATTSTTEVAVDSTKAATEGTVDSSKKEASSEETTKAN